MNGLLTKQHQHRRSNEETNQQLQGCDAGVEQELIRWLAHQAAALVHIGKRGDDSGEHED